MASAAASRGRPPGTAQSTIARAREAMARMDVLCPPLTLTVAGAQVAQEFGVAPSTIWQWRGMLSGPAAVESPGVEAAPKPRARMSQRTLLHRAWIAMRLIDIFRLLGDAVAMFWINTVLQIHEVGDDDTLAFGRPGDVYRTREELARAAGRTEAELDDLIHRGLLVVTEGGGIGLPHRFGLRPRERIGGDLVAAPPRIEPRQGTLPPMGMPAPRPLDSGFIQTADSGFNPVFAPMSGPDSGEIRLADSGNNRLAGGEGTTTTTTTKTESLLGGGGVPNPADMRESGPAPARDSGENTGPDSGLIPAGDSGKNAALPAAPPPWVTLASELLPIVGRPPHSTPAELNEVRAWLDAGASAALIREVVRTRMARKGVPSQPTLTYFGAAIRDRLAAVTPARVEPAAARAPEPPETPESTVAWLREDPDNPRLLTAWGAIRAALRAEAPADYRNWLRPMVLRGLDGDEIVIALPSEFVRDWVRDRHGARIEALWRPHYPEAHRVDFRVASG